MVYAYSENFILVLSHDEVVHGKCSMIGKMPGEGSAKFDNLRVAYGFMAAHPGKKLLFMGQEYAQFTEFNEAKSLEWFMLEFEQHKQMQNYVRDLNHLYLSHPAFYKLDTNPDGFEWINCISADETMVVFLRKQKLKMKRCCLFATLPLWSTKIIRSVYLLQESIKKSLTVMQRFMAVRGYVNSRVKQSKKDECDDREDSIYITVPPMGMSVFSCTHVEPAKTTVKKESAKKGSTKVSAKASGRKTSSKAAATKKTVKKAAAKATSTAKAAAAKVKGKKENKDEKNTAAEQTTQPKTRKTSKKDNA